MRTGLQFNKLHTALLTLLPPIGGTSEFPAHPQLHILLNTLLNSACSSCVYQTCLKISHILPPFIANSFFSWFTTHLSHTYLSVFLLILSFAWLFSYVFLSNFIYIFLNFVLLSLCLEEWPHTLFLIVRISGNIFLFKNNIVNIWPS